MVISFVQTNLSEIKLEKKNSRKANLRLSKVGYMAIHQN